MSGMKMAYVTI